MDNELRRRVFSASETAPEAVIEDAGSSTALPAATTSTTSSSSVPGLENPSPAPPPPPTATTVNIPPSLLNATSTLPEQGYPLSALLSASSLRALADIIEAKKEAPKAPEMTPGRKLAAVVVAAVFFATSWVAMALFAVSVWMNSPGGLLWVFLCFGPLVLGPCAPMMAYICGWGAQESWDKYCAAMGLGCMWLVGTRLAGRSVPFTNQGPPAVISKTGWPTYQTA